MATESNKEAKEIEVSRPTRGISPFDEMERWFENAFPRGWMQPFGARWPRWRELETAFEGRTPKVDVIDRDDEVLLRAEVPGVEKDDLAVSISDNSVTINGETKREKKEEKGNYYHCEISRGSFSRTVLLPSDVDTEKSKARFKDGVLELTLPKIEKSKRRTIEIE